MEQTTPIPQILLNEISRYSAPSDLLIFGGGISCFPFYACRLLQGIHTTVYDKNSYKMRVMQESKQFRKLTLGVDYNVTFVTGKPDCQFDVVLSLAAMHENPDQIIKEMFELTKKGGKVGIIDYDMKDMSRMEFFSKWGYTIEERVEFDQIGREQAYSLHTSFGLDDCIRLAESTGFNSIFAEGKLLSRMPCGSSPTLHFVYVGKREGT